MKSIYRPMIKSTYRLEITKAKVWEIDPEVGERFKWAEHALMAHYASNTTVVCTLESVEIIPIPAAIDQVRRSPDIRDSIYTCVGVRGRHVWLAYVLDGNEYLITYSKATFESWELVES